MFTNYFFLNFKEKNIRRQISTHTIAFSVFFFYYCFGSFMLAGAFTSPTLFFFVKHNATQSKGMIMITIADTIRLDAYLDYYVHRRIRAKHAFDTSLTQRSNVCACANIVMTKRSAFRLSEPRCLTRVTNNHISQKVSVCYKHTTFF